MLTQALVPVTVGSGRGDCPSGLHTQARGCGPGLRAQVTSGVSPVRRGLLLQALGMPEVRAWGSLEGVLSLEPTLVTWHLSQEVWVARELVFLEGFQVSCSAGNMRIVGLLAFDPSPAWPETRRLSPAYWISHRPDAYPNPQPALLAPAP